MQASQRVDLRHQALIFGSRAGLLAHALPFLQEGVDSGHAVMVISSPASVDAIHEALPAPERDAIVFEHSHDRYQQAARTLTAFQQWLAAHARDGQPVRVLSEQPLAALPPDQLDELCRVDAAFNEVSQAADATVVCAYDRRRTPAHVGDMLLRSHPEVIEGGERRASPCYTEPRTFLARQHRGPPLPAPPPDAAALPCPRDTTDAREFVAMVAGYHGLADPGLGRFLTAVNEVVSNAVVHAVLDTVLVWREDDRVICEVRDYGFGLADPLAGYRLPDPSWTSGRGIWLARQLADLVEVRTGLGGSTFRLHVAVGDASEPAP